MLEGSLDYVCRYHVRLVDGTSVRCFGFEGDKRHPIQGLWYYKYSTCLLFSARPIHRRLPHSRCTTLRPKCGTLNRVEFVPGWEAYRTLGDSSVWITLHFWPWNRIKPRRRWGSGLWWSG